MVLRMSKDRDYILRQLFEKLSVKESELLRPIIPVDQWVRDEYYVGKDGLKLYPFWRNVIKDIFESGQQYNQGSFPAWRARFPPGPQAPCR